MAQKLTGIYLFWFSSAGLKDSDNFFFTNNILKAMLKDVKSKLVLLCNARLNVNVAYHSKDKEVKRYNLTI